MNPEIKAKWLEALKSGKYKRGSCALKPAISKGDESYCCLGVLCDVHREMTGKGKWVDNLYLTEVDSHENVLPRSIKEWAEMGELGPNGVFMFEEEDGENSVYINKLIERGYSTTCIAEINDNSNKEDFSDVIPFIEKYF